MSDNWPSSSVGRVDARWWTDGVGPLHDRVLAVVRHIRQGQTAWHKRDALHASLYTNLPILGFSPNQYARPLVEDDRLVLNLIKAKVDTYTSLLTRSKPRPMFLPTDGGWDMRRKAKGLSRWFEGKFYELDFFDDIAPMCVLDTAVFDYGIVHSFIDNDVLGEKYPELLDVGVERVYPWEIVIDDAEALSGEPRNIYYRKWIDRLVLADRFPKFRAEIMDAPRSYDDDDFGRDDTSDQILTVQAWHLKSGPRSKDGKRAIVIPGATLVERPFEMDRLPFDFLQRTKPQYGIRGQSVVHELRPLQIAVNELLYDIQDGISLFARPKWVVNRMANVERAALDDDIGTIIEFDGPTPPQSYVPQAMSAEAYRFLWDIWMKADDIVGISEARSTGTVPTHLKSGKAAEINNDVQDGRFLVPSRRYEKWAAVSVPRTMIEFARLVAERNPKYAARYQHKAWVQLVEFQKVDMKRDEYVLKAYPASAFSTLPAQKMEQLQDLFDRGLIDQTTFQYQLDIPDLEDEANMQNAGRELTQKLIDRYLDADDPDDPDVFIAPEPLWPLLDMRARMQLAAAHAQVEGAPEANVALLRRMWSACDDMLKTPAANEPAAPQGAGNEAPPPDMGGAPPPPDGGPPMMNGAPPMGPPAAA